MCILNFDTPTVGVSKKVGVLLDHPKTHRLYTTSISILYVGIMSKRKPITIVSI